MARKKFEVEARISAKDDASKNVKKVESSFKRLTKTIKSSALAQVAAFAGVAVAIRGMVRAIGSAITAANKQAEAVNALEGALAPLGATAGKVSKALQEQAAALQKVTTFGDEEIIEAQALIASFVKEEAQIKAATVATLDLAQAKGMSLVSAADLMSKTLGSSTNAMSRYGIEVTGAVGSTERLTSLTGNIATVFGGRATKATEIFSGKVKQLGGVFGDMQEAMGEAITKSGEVGTSIDTLKDAIVKITPQMATLAESIVLIATRSLNAALRIGKFIDSVVRLGDVTKELNASAKVTAAALEAQEARTRLLTWITGLFSKESERAAGWTQALANRSKEVTDKMAAQAVETAKAKDELEKLKGEAEESATALEKLGDSLGEVTSAQLTAQILEIEQNLEAVRQTTGGIGPEFERLQEIATKRLTNLRGQLERLQDGLGSLTAATDDAGESIDDLAAGFDGAEKSAGALNRTLRAQAGEAHATSGELKRLTGVTDTLALAQERLELKRIQRQRSSIAGRNGSYDGTDDYALSPFGTGGKQKIGADGNLRPA